MSKLKTVYHCSQCGTQSPKWMGQCPDCQAWDSFSESVKSASQPKSARFSGYAGQSAPQVLQLDQVVLTQQNRVPTGLQELDLVLGGGLAMGSVVLLGGDPGIGKSTVLLQTLSALSQDRKVLYVTGEESLQQVAMRGQRLGLPPEKVSIVTATQVEQIIAISQQHKPEVMVIDSIQTLYTDLLQSAPGGVSQVKESAAQLVRFAKQTGTSLFLVGHVTKEGTLAGPRVLEHMVDTVLYFEGQSDSRYRVIRAVKNRFGAVNELGVFAMTDTGLKEVSNPSAIFLSNYQQQVSGSAVMVTWEGSRPILVEVQALVDSSHLGNPRRVVVGLEHNRLAMLLAVMHRHGGVATYDQDVFINVVGGMRISETSSDLAVVVAALSSLKDKPVSDKLVVFGEIGLAGEIRPSPNGQERLREAAKHGFETAIVPKANMPKKQQPGFKVIGVSSLSELIDLI